LEEEVKMIRKVLLGLGLSLAIQAPTAVGADGYPNRPIEMVVPYPAGNSMDIVARLLQTPLSKSLGQPVVIVNQGGASGVIGSRRVAKAAPDGYTLLVNEISALAVQAMKPDRPFDAVKDFTPVARVAVSPYMLVVNAKLPIKDVKDLVAMAKAKPGELNYASSGVGSPNHMSGELLKAIMGVNMVHVPYSGSAASIADTIAGRTEIAFSTPGSALAGIEGGQLRALGVTSVSRWPRMPEVPTIAEQGVKDFENTYNVAVYGPPGLPADVMARLSSAIKDALADPSLLDRYKSMGYSTPESSSPDNARKVVSEQVDKWGALVKSANIQIE
jgi:tripartite-type tricarboxylate transporter receptor subunit TctC